MIAVNDYIIVRKDRPETVYHGILLPYVSDFKNNEIGYPFTGRVESAGDLVTLVKKDDHIVFYDLSRPWIITDKDDIILIMKESDVIGILENGD
jgi:co-chaperonin GroES (HSP10)